MSSQHWKNLERAVAEALEGARVPASGNSAKLKGDVILMRLMPNTIGEVKHGRQVLKAGPKQLSEWLQEAERDARTAGTMGAILVLHPEGVNARDSLVVMRLGLLSGCQRALTEQARLPLEDGPA